MYTLRQLFNWKTQREINGKWVPARPIVGLFKWRLSDAWEVLTGRADAFVWPENEKEKIK